MKRKWWSHRQAYSPRRWPIYVAAPVMAALTFVVDVSWWVAGISGFVVGLAAGHLTYAVWKWRHPIVPAREQLERRRAAAPWN